MFAGAIVGVELIGLPAWLWILGMTGFGITFVTGMVAHFVGFHCPACHENLAPLYLSRIDGRIGTPIRFCPHCGEDFDELVIECNDRGHSWLTNYANRRE